MRYPVVSPEDRVIADLCLAADGLLDDHLAGSALEAPRPPGHRARLLVEPAAAASAVAAGGLIIADGESVPVVELRDVHLVESVAADPQVASSARVELAGTSIPAAGTATGVGEQLRVSRSPLAEAQARTVVVLGRPLLAADLALLQDELAGAGGSELSGTESARQGPEVVLAVPIAGPTPDGLPAAALLRLTQCAARVLRDHGLTARVVAVPLAWRDPVSDDLLAEAVAAGLGGSPWHLRPGKRGDRWARLLADLDGTDGVDGTDGAGPAGRAVGNELDDAVIAELRRWRPPRDRRGLVVFFTGLSGAGKSTLARALADQLTAAGQRTVTLLDGDEVRRLLSAGLGFGAEGRHQNVTRIGYVAAEVARHGGVAICAPIAPYERSRAAARELVTHAGGDFVLVHVATSLADCETRDVKGLYARARAGEIAEFTGVSDPYEVPQNAELRVETADREVTDSLGEVLGYLSAGGWLGAAGPGAVPIVR